MSILVLSSIINKNINVFYPDCVTLKYELLFGSQVHPRISSNICDEVNLFYVMHGSKLKAGDNYQPNHFVPCLFLPNHKLKRKATCGIIRTKKKAPRLQVQTKLPFWTSKFNDTFAFPRANNSGSCVVKNNYQNGSFVSSTISSVSSTASFNNSSVTSTISLCSPTISCCI